MGEGLFEKEKREQMWETAQGQRPGQISEKYFTIIKGERKGILYIILPHLGELTNNSHSFTHALQKNSAS